MVSLETNNYSAYKYLLIQNVINSFEKSHYQEAKKDLQRCFSLESKQIKNELNFIYNLCNLVIFYKKNDFKKLFLTLDDIINKLNDINFNLEILIKLLKEDYIYLIIKKLVIKEVILKKLCLASGLKLEEFITSIDIESNKSFNNSSNPSIFNNNIYFKKSNIIEEVTQDNNLHCINESISNIKHSIWLESKHNLTLFIYILFSLLVLQKNPVINTIYKANINNVCENIKYVYLNCYCNLCKTTQVKNIFNEIDNLKQLLNTKSSSTIITKKTSDNVSKYCNFNLTNNDYTNNNFSKIAFNSIASNSQNKFSTINKKPKIYEDNNKSNYNTKILNNNDIVENSNINNNNINNNISNNQYKLIRKPINIKEPIKYSNITRVEKLDNLNKKYNLKNTNITNNRNSSTEYTYTTNNKKSKFQESNRHNSCNNSKITTNNNLHTIDIVDKNYSNILFNKNNYNNTVLNIDKNNNKDSPNKKNNKKNFLLFNNSDIHNKEQKNVSKTIDKDNNCSTFNNLISKNIYNNLYTSPIKKKKQINYNMDIKDNIREKIFKIDIHLNSLNSLLLELSEFTNDFKIKNSDLKSEIFNLFNYN